MASSNTNLVVAFDLCMNNTCSSIEIEDTTGLYNAVTNVGGWGDPNPLTSEIITSTLEIEDPEGTITTLNLLTLSSNTFPGTSYDILPALLSITGKYPDGVYIFTLTFTGDTIAGTDTPWSSSTEKTIFFDCNTKCCLNALFARISLEQCCSGNELDNIIKGFMYLDGANYSACCGARNRAETLLEAAEFICSRVNCKAC